MALKRRCPDVGLLHHSDQGGTYASEDYQTILEALGIVCSMNRTSCPARLVSITRAVTARIFSTSATLDPPYFCTTMDMTLTAADSYFFSYTTLASPSPMLLAKCVLTVRVFPSSDKVHLFVIVTGLP